MKHKFGAYSPSSKGKGHPVMYGRPKPTVHFDPFPEGGGYPIRFLEWAFTAMGVEPSEVLHLCSGSVRSGVTVDIRHEARPRVVADARQLPFRGEQFSAILIDPPYSEEWARNLYQTEYPAPGALLREAARVLTPGGKVGLLHFQVPMNRKPLQLLGVWGITTGAGYAIRAWSLFKKAEYQSK